MARFSFCFVLSAVGAVLATVGIVGCGQSGPKTYPVTGKVTINGQPAKNCTINFEPVDSANQVASGQIADDGSYTLYTGTTGTPGAMAGKYKVVLTPDTSADMSYMESGENPGQEPKLNQSGSVPAEYMDAKTSPKEVEVTSGSNTIDIDIPSGGAGATESDSTSG